jgi:hypothetical protein
VFEQMMLLNNKQEWSGYAPVSIVFYTFRVPVFSLLKKHKAGYGTQIHSRTSGIGYTQDPNRKWTTKKCVELASRLPNFGLLRDIRTID